MLLQIVKLMDFCAADEEEWDTKFEELFDSKFEIFNDDEEHKLEYGAQSLARCHLLTLFPAWCLSISSCIVFGLSADGAAKTCWSPKSQLGMQVVPVLHRLPHPVRRIHRTC